MNLVVNLNISTRNVEALSCIAVVWGVLRIVLMRNLVFLQHPLDSNDVLARMADHTGRDD